MSLNISKYIFHYCFKDYVMFNCFLWVNCITKNNPKENIKLIHHKTKGEQKSFPLVSPRSIKLYG